ncbi:hypothetical protein BDZ89DRAFT_1140336 [Hymenopellis radicata]|nr:hypothetical protein BDZ89DRAFT_1140336 [Hymenopellis radicata]
MEEDDSGGVKQLAGDAALQSAVDKVAYLKELEAGKELDGVLRVIRGDGNGPLFALLDALRTHLHRPLHPRNSNTPSTPWTHQQQNARTAAYIGLAHLWCGLARRPQRCEQCHWRHGAARAEANRGFNINAKSGQADISSVIVNSLGLELTRRFQAAFFEVVQRAVRDAGGKISVGALTDLFKKTYDYNVINLPPHHHLQDCQRITTTTWLMMLMRLRHATTMQNLHVNWS